jgi:hypothetical protein
MRQKENKVEILLWKKSAKQVTVPALLITVEMEFTEVVLEIVFAFYFVFLMFNI